MSELFKRENPNYRLPFVDTGGLDGSSGSSLNGGITKKMSLLLVASAIIAISILLFVPIPQIISATIFTVAGLAFYGILSRCKFNLLVGSNKPKDIGLMLVITIISFVVANVLSSIYEAAGLKIVSDQAIAEQSSILSSLKLLCAQLIGEEMFKTLLLLGLIGIFVTFAHAKRKQAIIWSVILTTILFCICHYTAYSGNIMQLTLLIPSTVLTFYLYIRTKSVILTTVSHFLYDAIPIFVGLIFAK